MMHSVIYEEALLLQKVAEGDEKAFHTLYERYRDKVYYLAWKLLKSDAKAEDILQDIFIKVWVNRSELGKVQNFSAYLNTITRNHILNGLTRIAREESFIRETVKQIPYNHSDALDAVLLQELKRLVQEGVSQLSPQERKVFELSRLEGLKQEEIAARLDISLGTVKKHMVNALRFLREFLASHGKGVSVVLLLFLLP